MNRSTRNEEAARHKAARGLARLGATTLAVVLSLVVPQSTGSAQSAEGFGGSVLVADEIAFNRDTGGMEARGNVVVYHEGAQINATSMVYDPATDRVSVIGPITILDPAGGSSTLAEFADLAADLQDGVVIAVRHILADQLQLVADDMRRSEGRYTELNNVVASYCRVCEARPTPLWEIRARRATHDQIARMIYFRDAQFRLGGVPLAYTPYLRIPDPTLERANGFLGPSLRSSTVTGTSLRLPYFITLGDHADLTVAPTLSFGGQTNMLNTLDLRLRQSFARGDIEVNGAISGDRLTTANGRGYLFGNGQFLFDNGVNLAFQIQTVSDRSYLPTYNFFGGATETFMGNALNFNTSELNSTITVNRVRQDEIIQFNATLLDSLLAPDTVFDHPNRVIFAEYARWFDIPGLRGQFLFNSVGQADINDYGPTNARQRDMARWFNGLRWQESWALEHGLILDTELAGFSDRYLIEDDTAFAPSQSTVQALAVATLRRPWERTTPQGTRHTVEPFIRQLAFDGAAIAVPSVDGTIDDFDPNGRFALSRFRRLDRGRDLSSTTIGVNYMTYLQSGWSLGGGIERDYLWNTLSGAYRGGSLYTTSLGYRKDGLSFSASRAFNDDFLAVSDRVSLNYGWDSGSFSTNYTRISADQALATTSKTNLLSANLGWQVNETLFVRSSLSRDTEVNDATFFAGGFTLANAQDWTSEVSANYSIDDGEFDTQNLMLSRGTDWGGDMRFFYDFDRDEQRSVGLGLDYINECINLESRLLRRRSVVDTSQSAIELSVSLELGGFPTESSGRCS